MLRYFESLDAFRRLSPGELWEIRDPVSCVDLARCRNLGSIASDQCDNPKVCFLCRSRKVPGKGQARLREAGRIIISSVMAPL